MYNPIFLLIALIRALLIILSLLIIIPIYLLITTLGFNNTPKRAFWIRRQWLKYAIAVLGISVELHGKIPNTSGLYVCNHRSFSDPIVLARYLEAFVIAKAEVASLPLISQGAELTGIIYVKRENKDSRSAVRERLVEVIKEGKNVLVYPEGTVSANFMPLPYKKGTFGEAARIGFPVIPIVLEYKHAKNHWYKSSLIKHHFKQFGRLRTQCKLHIGQPMSNTDGLALCDEVEKWTHDTIIEIHKNWPGSVFHDEAKQINVKQE